MLYSSVDINHTSGKGCYF